jgi:hypothetical protein
MIQRARQIIAVLDLEAGDFTDVDGAGNGVKAPRRFRTRHVIRATGATPGLSAATQPP